LLPPSSNDGSPIFGGKKNLEDFRVELGFKSAKQNTRLIYGNALLWSKN